MSTQGSTLLERARLLEERGIFLGGPVHLFETAGRLALAALLAEGLTPRDKVLDIGCGCLRCGYVLVHYLEPNGYCGIEPNRQMVEAGVELLLEAGVVAEKSPRFDHNDTFDLGGFGERFDFLLARSIWSHASKAQIETMLDGFVQHATDKGVFLTSYLPATGLRRMLGRDYRGDEWVGRSHACDQPGVVRHAPSWIEQACQARGLAVRPLDDPSLEFGKQVWLRIARR